MTNDITIATGEEIQINPDATFDEWKEAGHALAVGTANLCWAWGKWWELGHEKYNSEAVAFVDNELPLARKTLISYGVVWRTFPDLTTRVVKLTFKHHRAVVAMRSDEKEMQKWLTKAVRNEWSAEALRHAINEESDGPPSKTCNLTIKRMAPLRDLIDEMLELISVPMLTLIPQERIITKLREARKLLNTYKETKNGNTN